MTKRKPTAVYWVWGLVLLLIVLHQDNWLWNNNTLVFGFMPIGLFFHACLSVAASATWFIAAKFAWPETIEFSEDNVSTDTTQTATTKGAAE